MYLVLITHPMNLENIFPEIFSTSSSDPLSIYLVSKYITFGFVMLWSKAVNSWLYSFSKHITWGFCRHTEVSISPCLNGISECRVQVFITCCYISNRGTILSILWYWKSVAARFNKVRWVVIDIFHCYFYTCIGAPKAIFSPIIFDNYLHSQVNLMRKW